MLGGIGKPLVIIELTYVRSYSFLLLYSGFKEFCNKMFAHAQCNAAHAQCC